MNRTGFATILLIAIAVYGCARIPPRQVQLELQVPTRSVADSIVGGTDHPFSGSDETITALDPTDGAGTAAWHPDDLWVRMRAGFQLSDYLPDTWPKSLSWYGQRQYYMDRIIEQAAPYLHFVLEEVEKRGMPTEIALLPVVESGYQPFAYSRSGAAGIWQFIPSTAKHYGLKRNSWYDGRRDIHASTRAALDFLQDLYKRLDNDWLLALAAYNSGGSTVERAVRAARRNGKSGDFWSIRPLLPEETRHYIPKLLAISAMVMNPDYYDITLKEIPNQPHLTRLQIKEQINLAVAARLAGLSLGELRQLNPGFTRLVTPPGGPHDLLLPIEKGARFKWGLSQLSPAERIGWIYHTVSPGENLIGIARHYGTTVAALRSTNRLRGSTIHPGDRLRIVTAAEPTGQAAGREEGSPSHRGVTHTVTNGDTLWSLARRYGVTVAQLVRWNAIATGTPLMPGQKLVVRVYSNT
ncbi:MAG TPA: LysM peptidoglycan-binding domain-containing protein [Gammaproteobacteria bacterium]|nr:LysM peptidoglycan-binding domain-containing protein [Gammaproteobacteria bacterium]